jgi:hypothetical protein
MAAVGDEDVRPGFTMDCDQCGFVYDESEHDVAAEEIVAGAEAIAAALRGLGRDGAAHARPDLATWSPVEYACHLRDVLLVQRERVLLARRSPAPPHPEPMGRDERVAHAGYADQDVGSAARQLVDAATMFAAVLDRLDAEAWDRTLVYNYPAPWERSLRWVAVHTVHEVRHHRQDVDRQIP